MELTPIRYLILNGSRVNILMLDFIYCLHVRNILNSMCSSTYRKVFPPNPCELFASNRKQLMVSSKIKKLYFLYITKGHSSHASNTNSVSAGGHPRLKQLYASYSLCESIIFGLSLGLRSVIFLIHEGANTASACGLSYPPYL